MIETTNTPNAKILDENITYNKLNESQKYELLTILSFQVTSMAGAYEVATAKQLNNHLGSQLRTDNVITTLGKHPDMLWKYFIERLSPNQRAFYENNIYWFLTYKKHMVPQEIQNMKNAIEVAKYRKEIQKQMKER